MLRKILLEMITTDGQDRRLTQIEKAKILERGERLHRLLRPEITEYQSMLAQMCREGARIVYLVDGAEVITIAVWRAYHTTYHGFRFYVDDLITSESKRSRGYGRTMLQWLERKARAMGADTFSLDCAVTRANSHRFYFGSGLSIFAFHFSKPVAAK